MTQSHNVTDSISEMYNNIKQQLEEDTANKISVCASCAAFSTAEIRKTYIK